MKSVENFQRIIFTHLSEVLVQKLVSFWIFLMTRKVLAQTIFFYEVADTSNIFKYYYRHSFLSCSNERVKLNCKGNTFHAKTFR